MAEVVGIRFKENGKIYYFDPDSKNLSKGEMAIVETVRGIECGEVASANHKVNDSEIVHPLKKILRIANKEDIKTPVNTKLSENSLAISIVEGWRGEVVHCVITGANGELLRYKIKDPYIKKTIDKLMEKYLKKIIQGGNY